MERNIRIADEVWLAAASLHRAQPHRADFTVAEIGAQAEAANITGKPLRPGIKVHVNQHCVANRAPSSGRYRMLVETGPRRRKLYLPGDPCHPKRSTGKAVPEASEIPPAYRSLVEWYRDCFSKGADGGAQDPVLALRGLGKALWANEDSDTYVQRLREGWR